MKKLNRYNRMGVILLGIISLFSALSPTPSHAEIASQIAPVDQLEGVISVIYGDPQDISTQETITLIKLLDLTNGQAVADLQMGIGLAHTFMGQAVQMNVARLSVPTEAGELPTYLVQDITPIPSDVAGVGALPSSTQGISTPQMTGAQGFVNLLCKFPDVASLPKSPSEYATLFANSYGGIDNFWRNMSYNAISLNVATINQWVTLPRNRSYYAPSSTSPNLSALLQDCANAADSLVDFRNYLGVNVMLNGDIGCCAWGGGGYVSNDGGRFMRATWNPPWSQNYETMAHEIGHALGLPHSSGPANDPPSELSIYVSNWDVMSRGGDCSQTGAWGCIPAGTIAYYLTLNDWIPAERQLEIPFGAGTTITLRRLRENVGSGIILAMIPINDSTTHFYSVEARDISGYDTNVPASAVIIHDIDLSRTGNTGPALVVDSDTTNTNVNDVGAQWLVGETFNDFANGISVRVVSKTGSDFVVEINNNAGAITFSENELLAQLQAHTVGGIEYLLVDYAGNSANIYVRVGTETALATIASTNNGGYLVRFTISQMVNPFDARTPLSANTLNSLNTHLLPTMTVAVDALVASRVANADIERVFFLDTVMGVVVAE